MRIGIVGRDDDMLSEHTEALARARGHDVLRIPFGQLASGAKAVSTLGGFTWSGEELGSCDGFVVRQYPAMHAQVAPADEALSGADWFRRSMAQVERSTFAHSALLAMELLGKPMVNPIGAMAPYEHKPLQLWALARAGLPVPDTIVTNAPDAVCIFDDAMRARGGASIIKPAAGGALAIALDDSARTRLDAIAPAPAIVQQRIPGDDVRVTVVAERVVSAVVIESDTLDYRAGDAYQAGRARYTEIKLPSEIVEMSVRAARVCHHVLSGIDWKRSSSGWFILEANSAPVYLDIEQKTGARITDAVLAHLENKGG